jgi:hypothetical protein
MTTKQRIAATAALVCLVGGCASLDGTYTPDCIAHAGNSIKLDGGRFVWDKFTDQVLVNDAGEVVDQFPEYPVRGRYRLEGETLDFESYTGEPLPRMHMRREGNRTFLLTDRQLEAWPADRQRTRCALVLGGYPKTD